MPAPIKPSPHAQADPFGGPAGRLPRRINVAVSPELIKAIERVIEREQVSLTEAVRRLVAYGDFVYRAVKEDRATILLRGEDGSDREIVLV